MVNVFHSDVNVNVNVFMGAVDTISADRDCFGISLVDRSLIISSKNPGLPGKPVSCLVLPHCLPKSHNTQSGWCKNLFLYQFKNRANC